jgi:hypothetical protein
MALKDWDPTLPQRAREAASRAAPDEMNEALKHATEFLDTLPFKGRRANVLQRLSWPRVGVTDKAGSPIAGVPQEIKDATALVAGFILAKVPFGAPALAHVFLLIGHLVEDGASLPDRDVTWH